MSIEQTIRRIAGEQLAPDDPGRVICESHIHDDLGADSLDKVELVMAIEDEFELDITDEEVEPLLLVSDFIDLIRRKLNKEKAA